MAIRFILFAPTRTALEVGLESLDPARSLEEILKRFHVLDRPRPLLGVPLQTSNHWALFDADGNEIGAEIPGDAGYGALLEGADQEVRELLDAFSKSADPAVRAMAGIDVSVQALVSTPQWTHWSAGTGAGRTFATRRHAARLIGDRALSDNGLSGQGVNVLVVDHGVSRAYVEALGGTWGGGFAWKPESGGAVQMPGEADMPYTKMPREHGAMIVRNVLAMAPGATIWDLPLIPRRIDEIDLFTLRASFAILTAYIKLRFVHTGRWVVVNAWGIGDRLREAVRGHYSNRAEHPLNYFMNWLATEHDVVFAAGNSGQFTTDPHRAPYDIGPGRSIWGANGLHSVLSVGAVRADTTWIGASSQGPGPPGLISGISIAPNRKPDLCVPSWFVEPHDEALSSTGTSAASAVAAGVLAALRQGWPSTVVTPAEMRELLRDTARRDWHAGWNGRMGAGILNVPRAISALETWVPSKGAA